MGLLEDAIRDMNKGIKIYDALNKKLGSKYADIRRKNSDFVQKIKDETMFHSLYLQNREEFRNELQHHHRELSDEYENMVEEHKQVKKWGILEHTKNSYDLLSALRNYVQFKEFDAREKQCFKALQIYYDSEFEDINLQNLLIRIKDNRADLTALELSWVKYFNLGPDFCNPRHEEFKYSAGKRKGYYLRKLSDMLTVAGFKLVDLKQDET